MFGSKCPPQLAAKCAKGMGSDLIAFAESFSKSAHLKFIPKIESAQLAFGSARNVSREQANDGRRSVLSQLTQQGANTGANLAASFQQFLIESREIPGIELLKAGGAAGDSVRSEYLGDDGAIGPPGKADVVCGIVNAEILIEGMGEGTDTGATCVDESAVDIEENGPEHGRRR